MKNKKIIVFLCFLVLFAFVFMCISSAALPDKYQSRFYVDWQKIDIIPPATSTSFNAGGYRFILTTTGNAFISCSDGNPGSSFWSTNSSYSGMYATIGPVTSDPYLVLSVTVNNKKYLKIYSSDEITQNSSVLRVFEYDFVIKNNGTKYNFCWYAYPVSNGIHSIVQEIEIFPLEKSFTSAVNDSYKIGENDGLNSGEAAKKTVFAIVSAPFIALSNIFSFEVFGLNFFTLIKILLTICLIGFIISFFRKG